MFAEILKQLRKSKGLTQVQFAKEFNISAGTIAMWETNKRIPDTAMLIKIAEFFGVSVDYLLGRESWDKESERFEEEFNDREEKLRAIIADYLKDPKDRETAVEIIRQFPRLSNEGLDKLKDRIEELVKLGY